MELERMLRIIKATAPTTPIGEAFALANEMMKLAPSDQETMIRWLDSNFSHTQMSNDTTAKINAIKSMRAQFNLGLVEAKRLVDYYIDHPDSINW